MQQQAELTFRELLAQVLKGRRGVAFPVWYSVSTGRGLWLMRDRVRPGQDHDEWMSCAGTPYLGVSPHCPCHCQLCAVQPLQSKLQGTKDFLGTMGRMDEGSLCHLTYGSPIVAGI